MPTLTLADHLAQAADEAQRRNLETVQHIYQCFMGNNIPGILEKLSDTVEWHHSGDPGVIPHAGNYKGKDGVIRFFQTLAGNLAFSRVEISRLRAYNNRVLFDVNASCMAKPTGKPFSLISSQVMVFDANGNIKECEITGDMTAAESAFLDKA
jgi:hypothetical protein